MSKTTPRGLGFVAAMLAGAVLMAAGIGLGAAVALLTSCPH